MPPGTQTPTTTRGSAPTRSAPEAPAPSGRGYQASKDDLLRRLARIKGQVGGVERMVGEDRYCIDVLTQIAAVQAALDKVALGLLDGHARTCVLEGPPAQREQRTEELMASVGRLMRRR
jgi:CsoR family transcriptional regulator, copper-sensing transcriptional repressor